MELDFSKKIATSKAATDCIPGLINLAIAYRGAQLAAHAAHHFISGPTFFEDHEFLGELYGTYEEAYDGIIEKIIGLGGAIDIAAVTTKACSLGASINPQGKSSAEIFSNIYALEKQFCVIASATLTASCSNGVQNFLQGLCDESEHRQYKIGQKIK